MNRKRKKIEKVSEDEELFEKLDAQNKALQKIIKKLKLGNKENNKNQ
jgi:hypothetical protein